MAKFKTLPGSGHYIFVGPSGQETSAYTLVADADGFIETDEPLEIAQLRGSGVLAEIVAEVVPASVPDKATIVPARAFDKKAVVKPAPAPAGVAKDLEF